MKFISQPFTKPSPHTQTINQTNKHISTWQLPIFQQILRVVRVFVDWCIAPSRPAKAFSPASSTPSHGKDGRWQNGHAAENLSRLFRWTNSAKAGRSEKTRTSSVPSTTFKQHVLHFLTSFFLASCSCHFLLLPQILSYILQERKGRNTT